MRAYKFLSADGLGVFSRFAWPLPGAGPGTWVESDVETLSGPVSMPADRSTFRTGWRLRCTRSSSTDRSTSSR